MDVSEYTINVPGELRGKQRARVTRRGHAYTPQQTVNAESWVKTCAVEQGVIRPLDGALGLTLWITRAIPPSWSKKKRAQALAGTIRATGKPDLDNIAKLVGDALNGIAWTDDSQIVSLQVQRMFGEHAKADIRVWRL
jgi:Holliday junction resolvase RusA-like endonuclease